MTGEHDICHTNAKTQAREFAATLRRTQIEAGVDAEIGVQVRLLTQPGVQRKIIRLDELRQIIADVDARWARQVTQ